MKEIKLRVRNSEGKLLAIEIFNQKFGWHHVYIDDARKYGMNAPIQLGTYPDNQQNFGQSNPINERIPFESK